MITVWRLIKEKEVKAALTGEGARIYGGRCNNKGIPAVYASGTLSLAALELFVHLGLPEIKIPFASIRATIPDDVAVEAVNDLPNDWREEPAPDSTKEIGTDWFRERRSAVLRVPSAVVPSEFNYVLNPEHPDFGKITIEAPERFYFDPRMYK